MFPCNKCGAVTRVTDSRQPFTCQMRVRQCVECGNRFMTTEVYEWDYRGQVEPIDVVMARRQREKEARRLARLNQLEKDRLECKEIMKTVGCINCTLERCVEDE